MQDCDMVINFEAMKDLLKDGIKEEENDLIKEQLAMEDSNIMIDFEAVKNSVKKEIKVEDKFVVDLKSWADAFAKKEVI